jgi:transcriptional repressor NF-X1
MSCGHPCGKLLGCGNHKCAKTCHPGECGPCEVMVPSRCWCGKHERELGCGKGEPRLCTIITPAGEREQWTGRFECAATCERYSKTPSDLIQS